MKPKSTAPPKRGPNAERKDAQMKFLNVEIPVKNLPELDQGFVPLGVFFK